MNRYFRHCFESKTNQILINAKNVNNCYKYWLINTHSIIGLIVFVVNVSHNNYYCYLIEITIIWREAGNDILLTINTRLNSFPF
jgi:hypothetical protein